MSFLIIRDCSLHRTSHTSPRHPQQTLEVWSQHCCCAESIPSNPAVHGGACATFSAYAIDAPSAIGLGGAAGLGDTGGLEETWLNQPLKN